MFSSDYRVGALLARVRTLYSDVDIRIDREHLLAASCTPFRWRVRPGPKRDESARAPTNAKNRPEGRFQAVLSPHHVGKVTPRSNNEISPVADAPHDVWAQLFADFTNWRYLGKTPFEFERLIGQLPDPVDTPEATPPGIFSVARRLGAEGVARLIVAYESGTPTTQLTRDFGIAKGSVLRLLEQNGVAMRQQPIPAELIPKAAELYNEGLSLTAVSDRLGVNRSTLFHAFRRAGVTMRPTTGGRSRA